MYVQRKRSNISKSVVVNTFETTDDNITEDVDQTTVETQLNIVLVGNRNVGKTSFLFKYAINMYSDLYQPTQGVDFRNIIVETHQGQKVNVKLWDTPGNIETQKGKSMVMKNLYGNAHAFIIMYDVTNIQSYNDVYEWMELIQKFALDQQAGNLVILGNKTDLHLERKLSKEDGIKLAAAYNAKFMETNVPHKKNIHNTVKRMVTNLLQSMVK